MSKSASSQASTTHIGPWQQVSRKTVYENPWIRVTHDQVKTPAGTDGIYGVVHFKSRAIGIVALDEEHNIWLVGQTRYALNHYSWELPEGGCPLHEEPLDTAKRELKEETGLSAQQWQPLLRMHLSNSVCDEEAQIFLATELTQGETELEETEDITVRKMPFHQALQMVDDGEITDAISVAAILAVERKLRP